MDGDRDGCLPLFFVLGSGVCFFPVGEERGIAVFNQNVCGFFVRIFFLALPLFLGPFRAPDNPVVFLVCSWWWAS